MGTTQISKTMATFFKDLGKPAKDLLTKDYPSNFELTAEAKVATQGDVIGSHKTTVTRNNDGSLSGSFNPKWEFPSLGAAVQATIFTSKKLELEASVKNKGVVGLKSILKVTAPSFEQVGKEKDAQSVHADLEYQRENATVAVGLDLIAAKPQVSAALTGNKDQWTAGVETKYSVGAATDLASLAIGVLYQGLNWSATVLRNAQEGASNKVSYTARLYQKVDDALQVGAEIGWSADANDAGLKPPPTLVVGGKYRGAHTDFKAKCGTNGRVGVSYSQDVNYFTSVTLGLDLSTADSKDHKLGLSVDIHDSK